MGEPKDKKAKEARDSKKYIPEIIEAEDNDGNETWYFALIEEDKHKDYETARDAGNVQIKQNGEGALQVCFNDEILGKVIDSGHGEPGEEQKQDFIKSHGVPVHHEEMTAKDKAPVVAANDGAEQMPPPQNNPETRRPDLKP